MFSNVSFILFVDNTDINISTGTLGEHPLLECTLNYALPVHSDLRTTVDLPSTKDLCIVLSHIPLSLLTSGTGFPFPLEIFQSRSFLYELVAAIKE